ncbi:MAG: helix-turn-helix transcriptional regulator [Polyangiaceae bacterium]
MSEIARSSEQVATVARADVMTTRDWHRSFKFNEIYGPSQIADSMVSLMRVNANANADANGRLFVFKRALNDGAFSERERELVTLLLSECRWLHEVPEGSRSSRLEALSRREREVLKILLTGAPEKGVASLLGISRHTAHQYVKSIYRKLAVTSRAQLMAERTLPRELVKSA